MHTLPRCHGLIFPFEFQMPYFLHWLFSGTLLTQLKPPEASHQHAKKLRVVPSSSRWDLRAPDPTNLRSEKLTSQPTCFCCAYFPKSATNLHRLFHNLTCFSKLRHLWVSYISWYVLVGMSLTCLPLFA